MPYKGSVDKGQSYAGYAQEAPLDRTYSRPWQDKNISLQTSSLAILDDDDFQIIICLCLGTFHK